MLKLNELKPALGAKRTAKRIGRGPGSGNGCTAGKGNNGDGARSGSREKFYFEGGQTPLTRKIPKRGFFNPFRVEFQIVNIGILESLENEGKEITVDFLYEKGLIHDVEKPVKVLGDGELKKSLVIKAHSFSKAAKEKIEKAKGKAEVVGRA